MISLIQNNISQIISLCKKHHVVALSVFGSAAKKNMHKGSDIDFLVKFSDDLEILQYADNYFDFLHALETLTGKSVDLVSVKSLKNPILIDEILNTKIDLYAA